MPDIVTPEMEADLAADRKKQQAKEARERAQKTADGDIEVIDEDRLAAHAAGEDREPGQALPPKRLTDAEKRDHENAMNRLHREMCDLNDRMNKESLPDGEQQWNRMAKEYDDHAAQVDAHRRWASQSAARSQRLENMAERGQRLPKEVRDRLKGGFDPGMYDADESHERMTVASPRLPKALKGWWKAQIGRSSAITQDELEACRDIGFSPYDNQMHLPILDSAQYSVARDIFLGQTSHLTRGHKGWDKARHEAQREILDALSTETSGGPQTENELFGTMFVTNLEEAVLAYGGLIANVDVLRTPNGNPIYYPTADDTGNTGRMIDEAIAMPPAAGAVIGYADPSFGNMTLYAFLGTSDAVAISNSLLEDNQVMLATVLPRMLGTRIGRLKNRVGTIGTGVANSQPDGIVPQSALGDTAASTSAIVLDEIFDMTHAIDPAIRDNNELKWMFHDQTLNMFRKIKDSEGRYLWQRSAESGAPDTLDGRQWVINQDMPQLGTGNRSVIFGNLNAYKWRDVVGPTSDGGIRLSILRELYAESDQTAYMAFCRFDGRLLNPGDNPVVHLIHP